MHQLRYPDEIKPWDEVPVGKLPKPETAELHLAEQIIAQLRETTFHADRYKDEVKGRVRSLIAKKAKGGEIVAPPEAPKPEVTDLMAALKASLSGGREAPAARDRGRGHAKNGHAKTASAKNGHATHKRTARARPAAHRARASAASHRAHR
jgi:DNA end-binding protein Ku